MATFEKFAQLQDEKVAKGLIKKGLDKVKPAGMKFLYYEKFELGGKEVPLVLVDYAPTLQADIRKEAKKAPSAMGQCVENAGGAVVFRADVGAIKQAALKKFLAGIPGMRDVADAADDAAPAAGTPARTTDTTPAKPGGSEGARRLEAFSQKLKAVPRELQDSFLAQREKVKALLAKGDEAGALKLLAQLEAMAEKALARNAPEVGDLKAALADSITRVDAALKKIKPDPACSMEEDLRKGTEFKAFDALRKSPSGAADGKAIKAAAEALVKQIDAQIKLVTDWNAYLTKTKEELAKEFEAARKLADTGAARLVKAFTGCAERTTYLDASKDKGAYAKRPAVEKAVAAMRLKLDTLAKECRAWHDAEQQADKDIASDLNNVAAALRDAVDKALKSSAEWTALATERSNGKATMLPLKQLTDAVASVRKQLGVLAEIEKRRARGIELTRLLNDTKAKIDPFKKRCNDLIAKIDAPASAVALTWRSAAMTAEFAADRTTIVAARTAAETLGTEIDKALTELKTDPPLAATITSAEATHAKTLASIDAADKRVADNLAKTALPARVALIQELLDAAQNDPARLLSRSRSGQILGAARKGEGMARADVVKAIADEVHKQHNPPLREWFKVLQLGTNAGGNIKLGNLGSVALDPHRTRPLHMTLYIANVGAAPSVNAGVGAIMNTLLPPVVGHVGTHVTLELNGPISSGNPHLFHGEAAGRPNDLADRPKEWAVAHAEMSSKLHAELARLTDLVQSFVDRKGKWPGE